MSRFSFSMVAFFCSTMVAAFSAQAQTANDFFAKYKRAVVKLTVTGKDTQTKPKPPVAGSGFVIFSGSHNSLILTAAHVIGSSDRRQMLNPDWLVGPDGRTLDRAVKIEILDERGALTDLGQDASVLWQDDQKDIALLLIDRTNLPSIPYAERASDIKGDLQDVLLLGFPKDDRRLTSQQSTGGFQSSPQYGFVFRVQTRVREGLSGGPVIDLASGAAIAAVSEDLGAQNEHYAAPLFPIIPAIAPYVMHANTLKAPSAAEVKAQAEATAGQKVEGCGNTAVKDVGNSSIIISGDRNCK